MTACNLIENSIFYNYGLFGLVFGYDYNDNIWTFYYCFKLIAEIWGCGNVVKTQDPTVSAPRERKRSDNHTGCKQTHSLTAILSKPLILKVEP